MEAYTSTLGLVNVSLTYGLICPPNALSHLKLVPGFWSSLSIVIRSLSLVSLTLKGWGGGYFFGSPYVRYSILGTPPPVLLSSVAPGS